MLNISNHKINADQNHNAISPLTPVRVSKLKKRTEINADEDVERKEPLYTVDRNIN